MRILVAEDDALYRAIVCSFAQTLDPDRDQSKTKETLELTQTFLLHPTFVTYRNEVKKLQGQCQQKLFESEMGIAQFYTHRGDYRTAQRRLDDIKVSFSSVVPKADVYILAAEYDIADKQKDAQRLAEKHAEYIKALTQNAAFEEPDTMKVAVADKLKKRTKAFSNRF